MPGGHRAHVVLAQRLHRPHLQSGAFQQPDGVAQGPHVHVGGDVRLDEGPAARCVGAARHLLHEDPSPRPYERVQGGGEGRVLGIPDVLAHLDAGDGVVGAAGDVPVVLAHHLHPVFQAAFAYLFPDMSGLFLGQGDGGDLCLVLLGGVQRERAPAAADVEQPGTGDEAQLAADQLQFGALGVGGGEAGVLARPVAARVGHRVVEEQPVEGVGQVVVVTDGGTVAGLGVQPAPQPRLGGGREPRCVQAPLAYGGPHDAQPFGQVALDVDLAGHVGLGQAQFAGLPEHPPQGAPGPDDDGGAAGRAGLAVVPGAQPDREGTAERVLGERGDPVGGSGPDGSGGGHRTESSFVNRYCWTSRYPERNPASE